MEKVFAGGEWILPVLAVLLLIAALIIWQRKKQETEYTIIQAIIEELPYYQDGGMYCFYYGFDQYISERTYKENMLLFPVSQYDGKEYEEVLKTVRLQISKRTIEQEPFLRIRLTPIPKNAMMYLSALK